MISKNGKFAYDTNTGSSSISSFAIGSDGSLTLLDPQAALSSNGRFLYARSGGTNTISSFRVQSDGGLEYRGEVSVPLGSVGLAAR